MAQIEYIDMCRKPHLGCAAQTLLLKRVLLRQTSNDLRGYVQEENGCDERQRKDEDNKRVAIEVCQKLNQSNNNIGRFIESKDEMNTHILRPGESSVYSFNIVFELPPAPAARDEFGRPAALLVARRLFSVQQCY